MTVVDFGNDAISMLERLGEAVTAGFSTVSSRRRRLRISSVESNPAGADIHGGLHLACPEGASSTVDFVLSAYARHGYFPEFQNFLYCSQHTSSEEVCNIVLRWRSAGEGSEGRHEDRGLYCIASPEALSYESQQRLVQAVRDSIGYVGVLSAALFVVCSPTSYVATQFASRRVPYVPLPLSNLQIHHDSYDMGSVVVHASEIPGAGKTFGARTVAKKNLLTLVHVPVHTALSPLDLILHIESCYQTAGCDMQNEDVCLHFDMTDTITGSFEPTLFGLIFLGGQVCPTRSWFWSTKTVILLEVMSGGLMDRLRSLQVLARTDFVSSSLSFCTDEHLLRIGMGTPDFDSETLHQGTDAVGLRVNALERLQYVCAALHILDLRQGDFPIDYDLAAAQRQFSFGESSGSRTYEPKLNLEPEAESESEPEVCHDHESNRMTSARCYDLLEAASKQQHRPSLWCIWSFVNVLYWQLTELHDQGNIINNLCRPDLQAMSSHDAETKRKIKCEIVRFVIKTAAEFSCRQFRIP
eukprot:SAG11_NODE_137_length_15114_cov_2.297303_3_plen_526_part_00